MTAQCLTVALAGNPNCGKTTIFNNITGARQHVGNYPGVTVEKKEGFCRRKGQDILVVDLPGSYSLTAHSPDEAAARRAILDDRPDMIVNILDASNLERNLYLAVQLLELGRPMAMGLNMTDVAQRRGLSIDTAALSQRLGIPVVCLVGSRNQGTEDLLDLVAGETTRETAAFAIDYGPEIEPAIKAVSDALLMVSGVRYPLRWLAIRLLEEDGEMSELVMKLSGGERSLKIAQTHRKRIQETTGEAAESLLVSSRYAFVGQLFREVAQTPAEFGVTPSDRIDRVLTHRWLGLPIFLGIMWLLFNMVFTVGQYPQDWLEGVMKMFGTWVGGQMAEGELRSLLVDGVVGGVGSVVSFLPQILLLFLAISLLEDTGYMARAAFVMDRLMRSVGLHGKAFIPLLLGFGCNVPAIMGTRTLENPRDRMVTILVMPMMSCSARLPVYTLLAGAFFAEEMAGTVLFGVYLLGIIMAVATAKIFRRWMFPGVAESFVMEMPQYHWPTLRSVTIHMWERSALYLKKAGTLILAASVLVWFLTNYPNTDMNQETLAVGNTAAVTAMADIPEELEATATEDVPDDEAKAAMEKQLAAEKLANSYAGQLGQTMEPLIKPLGFDWKMGVGLLSAVAAKEVLVSTLGTIYSTGDAEDGGALQEAMAADPAFRPLVALALMVFTLLYSPCLAALAVIRRETDSWRWPLFSFVYSTALAYVLALVIYQAGSYLGY
ncbi:MAG TPA: ferrous iron transport protein B [Patescibacteria group bacterium]|nr:ferrous iron transport protein B [Patescibacteria group bacterium]